MQVTFKRNLSQGLRFNFNYTWSHAIDNVAGFFKDYQNEFDTSDQRGSSDVDVRHNFTFDASYEVPSARRWFGDNTPRWIADGWQISSITQFRTGLPINVTRTGGTFGGFSLRPNLVPGADPYNDHQTLPNGTVCNGYRIPDCQFNFDAFDVPTGPGGSVHPGQYSKKLPAWTAIFPSRLFTDEEY